MGGEFGLSFHAHRFQNARARAPVDRCHPARRAQDNDGLPGIDRSRADLSGADLSGAYLSRANLSHADLSRADLSHADLYGADLTRAGIWRDGQWRPVHLADGKIAEVAA